MTLQALIILARVFCPWQPDPLPYTMILPDATYEMVERRWGLSDTVGLTVWSYRAGEINKPIHARVYLRQGADERDLCHEWRHAVEGHWHP